MSSKSKNRKGSQGGRVPAICTMILALSLGSAVTQTAAQAQEATPPPPRGLTYTHLLPQAA